MADAIQFTIPENDFIELTGAGANGSLQHQGGLSGSGGNIVLVESTIKPAFQFEQQDRFKTNPASLYLKPGESETYFDSIAIWAVSVSGDQLLTVTPSA